MERVEDGGGGGIASAKFAGEVEGVGDSEAGEVMGTRGSRGKGGERSLHCAARHRVAVERQERAAAVGMTVEKKEKEPAPRNSSGRQTARGTPFASEQAPRPSGDAGVTEEHLRRIVGRALGRVEALVGG